MCLLMYVGIFTCKAPRALFWICALHQYSLLLYYHYECVNACMFVRVDGQMIGKCTCARMYVHIPHCIETSGSIIHLHIRLRIYLANFHSCICILANLFVLT